MRNRSWALFILLLLCVNKSGAQGVNGRRMILGGRFDYFVSFAATDKSILTGWQVNAGYVLSRDLQINIAYNTYNIGYRQQIYDSIYFEKLGDATDQLNVTEYEGSLKLYLRKALNRYYDCIAPDGKYIEVGFVHSKIQYDPGSMSYYSYNRIQVSPTASSARFFVGIGNQQVWWGRIVANTGVQFSITFLRQDEPGYSSPTYIDWAATRNLFRCYVGIGFLL
jgi:hypothetical protein